MVAIKTVYGILSKGVLETEEDLRVVAYQNIKKEFPHVEGFFNLKWEQSIRCWIIFQVVPAVLPELRWK